MIAVCGEALVDFVGGVPHPGGGPFNTARALARLSVPTAFLGRLSTDAYGQELARLLREDGVDISMASRGAEPTTAATVTVDSRGVATYAFNIVGTSAPNLTTEMLPEELGKTEQALKDRFGADTRVDSSVVSPSFSAELIQNAIKSIALASLLIVLLIAWAFRNFGWGAFRYGIAAIVALLHDAAVVLGIVIALLVFGPKKLPELGKGIGEGIRGFRSAMQEEEKPANVKPIIAGDQS